MAEDESHLVAVRREQEVIIRDAQSMKDRLLEMIEDPAYESLDARRLKSIENKLEALLLHGSKTRGKLIAEEVNEDLMSEDHRRWNILEQAVERSGELCSRLMATRDVHAQIQTADRILSQLKDKRLEYPGRDYSLPVKRVADKVTNILEILEISSIPADHKLRARAMELEISLEDMEIVDVILTPEDYMKTPPKPKAEPPKMQAIAPPTFSGRQRDWQAFWAAFRDIHNCSKYSNTAKLCYLRQAQKDDSLHKQLCENIAHGDDYDDVVAGLQDQYDRPREDHRIYLENVTKMEPVKPTRASLMACATSLQSSINGMSRLGQIDIQSIFTTLVEPLLPEKVKYQWEESTVEDKQVPAADRLIAFLRKRAAMPQYADKMAPTVQTDRRPPRQQTNRPKGSVHLMSGAPASPQPQPVESKPTSTNAQPTWTKPKGSYPPCKYSCPLCKEAHYAWACAVFKAKTLTQRKEHVQANNLCKNCLKPGHNQVDCMSRFTCLTCGEKHNTLLHSGNNNRNNGNNNQTNGTINLISNNQKKAKLLMTCEVMITGPTGKSMPVRALLDSGADTCSITSKIANHLKLKNLKETVAVTSFANDDEVIFNTTSFQISSRLRADWNHQVVAVIVDKITGDQPMEDASAVKAWSESRGLTPADPKFHKPGRIDVLIGADVLPFVQTTSETPTSVIAVDTVFGHAFMGTYVPTTKGSIQLAVTTASKKEMEGLNQQLIRFWEAEQPLVAASPYSKSELRALAEYADTHRFNQAEKLYQVSMPRRLEKRQLGESKTQALQRYFQNIRSLEKKGSLQQFKDALQEYVDLGHARLCTEEELQMPSSQSYYLPMFGVVKTSSTTTKLRIVFDASAGTTSGYSLNDILEAGPMMHPKMTNILIKFRQYKVALTGDIAKMYRQVLLSEKDQNFHRFYHQPDPEKPPQVYCMSRVTFGVTCSPFLAVRTLQQTATDFGKDCPEAQKHINQSFYVDDLLGGADSIEETKTLYKQLAETLQRGGFTLRKYRSSSQEVLDIIPEEFKESLPTKEMVDQHSESYPKALGIIWNSVNDTMSIDVNYLGDEEVRSKRDILSDTFKTFDAMGWITPAILPMKILIQKLWQMKVDWNDELPEDKLLEHQTWRKELPVLSDVSIPRCYSLQETTLTLQLHGFSDASKDAFGAVIYLRATYTGHSPTARLVTAKSRVAPLKQRTIPELELCAAALLANMMETTASILKIPEHEVYGWIDNTIVLCWLKKSPSEYNTFVGNRIATTTSHYPSSIWRHVPTLENPADCASRGVTAQELKNHHLWWNGPCWLTEEPVQIPVQPSSVEVDQHKDLCAKTRKCLLYTTTSSIWLVNRYSSYHTLTKVTAWVLKAAAKFKRKTGQNEHASRVPDAPAASQRLDLTVKELEEAEQFLTKRAQRRSYKANDNDIHVSAPPPAFIFATASFLSLYDVMSLFTLVTA